MENYYNTILNFSNIEANLILEIGSRDGHDANKLKNLFSLTDQCVWVVEPNPQQCEMIRTTYPNFNLVDKAIFKTDGIVDFNKLDGDEMMIGTSSILDRVDNWYISMGAKKIKVESITGKKLLEMINSDVDVCKIDVEGLTYEVLESFGDDIFKIKSFHIECEHSEVWKNQKLYGEIELFLIKNNFTSVYSDYYEGKLQSDSIWINNNFLK